MHGARWGLIVFTVVWVSVSIATGQDSVQSVTDSARLPQHRAPSRTTESTSRLPSLADRQRPSTDRKSPIQLATHQVQAKPDTAQTSETAVAKQPAFLDLTSPQESVSTAAGSEPSDTDLLIRFGVWTIIVICCCGLTVLAIRRWQRKQGILPATNLHSRVLETVALGGNRSVSLVQLRDVRAVVGCDGTGVTSIVLAPHSFEDALIDTDTETYSAA